MKFPRFMLVMVGCALAILQPAAARAFDIPAFDYGNNAPMPAAVVRLYTDLNGIPVGTAPTDAQHQALVADLNALATGTFTPDPADIDQLATDLGTAATAGLFSDNVLEYLADDFIGAPGDPDTDPDGWMDDIQDDVSSLIDPPETVFDPGDGDGTTLPTDSTIYALGATAAVPAGSSSTRTTVRLIAQGIPQYLLENYSGQAHLISHTAAGGSTVDTLRLNTSGLPLTNPYTVSITRRSDGASVTVGKMRVHNGFDGLGFASAQPDPAGPQAELLSFSHAVFGGSDAKKSLPAGFDADDVATVTVTDAQGVVRLTGNVAGSTASSQVQTLNLRLNGTSVAPAPAPYANVVVRHKVVAAKTADRFRFMAHHLPVNASVTLWADGVMVDQYTTTAHGRLFIIEGFEPTKLHRNGVSPAFNGLRPGTDLSATKSFVLKDAQGTVLLSGSLY